MSEPFSAPPQVEPSRGPWLGLSFGAVLVVVIVGYMVYSSRSSDSRYVRRPAVMQSSGAPDAYAAKLQISNLHLLAAENMLGGSSTYVEGKITNTGDKIAVGATVEITFRNSLNQIVQRESHILMVILRREPAVDLVALSAAPLNPGESREFRLTFEHISADWSGQYPEVEVKLVNTK